MFRDIVQQFALRKTVNLTNQNPCSAVAANPALTELPKRKKNLTNPTYLTKPNLRSLAPNPAGGNPILMFARACRKLQDFPEKKNLANLTNLT